MRLAVLAILCSCVVACGPLTPTQSCGSLIDRTMECGTYTVGTFGGTSEADDRARCAAAVGRRDDCRSAASSYARCAADHACADIDVACAVRASSFFECTR